MPINRRSYQKLRLELLTDEFFIPTRRNSHFHVKSVIIIFLDFIEHVPRDGVSSERNTSTQHALDALREVELLFRRVNEDRSVKSLAMMPQRDSVCERLHHTGKPRSVQLW